MASSSSDPGLKAESRGGGDGGESSEAVVASEQLLMYRGLKRAKKERGLRPRSKSVKCFHVLLGNGASFTVESPGFHQEQVMPGPGARHMMPPVGPRPPVPVAILQVDEEPPINQPKSRVPELEKHLVDQLSTEEQNSLNSKFKEATEADKKVEELEKENLESREKIDFYLQKCKNSFFIRVDVTIALMRLWKGHQLIKERESLARKYEEKYKQSREVASKLTIEEATFRDIWVLVNSLV